MVFSLPSTDALFSHDVRQIPDMLQKVGVLKGLRIYLKGDSKDFLVNYSRGSDYIKTFGEHSPL